MGGSPPYRGPGVSALGNTGSPAVLALVAAHVPHRCDRECRELTEYREALSVHSGVPAGPCPMLGSCAECYDDWPCAVRQLYEENVKLRARL